MAKKTKPDTWEVYYCSGVTQDSDRVRYIFRGKKFGSLIDAWNYARKSIWDIRMTHHNLRLALITQNGEKPGVESVVYSVEGEYLTAYLQSIYWLPYQAILPPEYLTADGVRPLPWRSTLARLRKAVARKGYYEDPNPKTNQ